MAFHILLGLAVYWLAWSIFRSPLAGFAGGLIVVFINYTAFDAGNGLETTLFMVLVAATTAACFTFRSLPGRLLTGVLLGLAILTRPEGAFLIPAILAYLWLERQPDTPLSRTLLEATLLMAPAVVVLGGLAAFSWLVNGTPLPGTASAKLNFFQENRWKWPAKFTEAADGMGAFFGPLVPIVLVASLTVRRRESVLPGIFYVILTSFYIAFFPGGMFHYFYRYQHPVLPFLAAFAGGGVAYLAGLARDNGVLAKLLVAAGLVLLAIPMWQNFSSWRDTYREASFETHVDLEGMAKNLNTIILPDQTLATHDIGAVGYFGKFHVLDLVGLVNPEAARYQKNRQIAKYIDIARPDYLLVFPSWDYNYLHIDPGAHPDRYQLVKVYPGRKVRVDPYVLYRITYPKP